MIKINCPYSKYEKAKLHCIKNNQLCGNVRYCDMAGRWIHNEMALRCPLREDKKNG